MTTQRLLPVLRIRNHRSLPGFTWRDHNKELSLICVGLHYPGRHSGGKLQSCRLQKRIRLVSYGFVSRGTNIVDKNGSVSFYINERMNERANEKSRLSKKCHEREWSNIIWLMLWSLETNTNVRISNSQKCVTWFYKSCMFVTVMLTLVLVIVNDANVAACFAYPWILTL